MLIYIPFSILSVLLFSESMLTNLEESYHLSTRNYQIDFIETDCPIVPGPLKYEYA